MNLTLWKPFTNLERVFEEDFDYLNQETHFTPKVHVEEKNDNLLIQAELPGMDEKDIKVDIDKGILTISGERKTEKREEKDGVYFSEISFGKFERKIKLPDYVNADDARAEYKKGILNVHLGKHPEKKPKQIEVKSQ